MKAAKVKQVAALLSNGLAVKTIVRRLEMSYYSVKAVKIGMELAAGTVPERPKNSIWGSGELKALEKLAPRYYLEQLCTLFNRSPSDVSKILKALLLCPLATPSVEVRKAFAETELLTFTYGAPSPWIQQEIDLVTLYYQLDPITLKALLAAYGYARNIEAIRQKLSAFRLLGKRKTYTTGDIEWLKQNVNHMTNEDIAKKLECTESAVVGLLHRQGITRAHLKRSKLVTPVSNKAVERRAKIEELRKQARERLKSMGRT